MQKTRVTTSELKDRIKVGYDAGPHRQPLGDVEIAPRANGTWMAYPDPELEHHDDKHAFLAVVSRAMRDYELALE